MEIKTIVILIAMLSMVITCSAETGTLEIDETFDCDVVVINVDSVNYDATVEDYYTGKKYDGNYDIRGTADFDGKVYNADFNAFGGVWIRENQITHLELQLTGKIYQNSELGHLYREDGNDYYGYVENGYNVNGNLLYDKSTAMPEPTYLIANFAFDPYSKYVVTDIIPQEDLSVSSLGYSGEAMGDVIPILYAYKDTVTKKRVVSETYPTDHNGPVITMPSRIKGEPLFANDFWTTPKGISILEKKASRK